VIALQLSRCAIAFARSPVARALHRFARPNLRSEIILRFQKARTRLCEQSGRVLHVHSRRSCPFFTCWPFDDGDFFDEGVECARITRAQIGSTFPLLLMDETMFLARGHNRREFSRLASAQQEEQIRQYGGRKKENRSRLRSLRSMILVISEVCQVQTLKPSLSQSLQVQTLNPRYLRVCKYKP